MLLALLLACRDPDPLCADLSECCAVCDSGVACGDACISMEDRCSLPDGCACNLYPGCSRGGGFE